MLVLVAFWCCFERVTRCDVISGTRWLDVSNQVGGMDVNGDL